MILLNIGALVIDNAMRLLNIRAFVIGNNMRVSENRGP